MPKIAMAVHGGASDSSRFLRKNHKEYQVGLYQALQLGYKILKRGGKALDAVEESVRYLEDNPLFNAGRGSALNMRGEVEMDASIMNGKNLKAGAVAMVRNIRNPVSLARDVMETTKHVFLSGYGALDFARTHNVVFEPETYFITQHQYEEFLRENKRENLRTILEKQMRGTVGAVALDKHNNLAAATSTGGTTNCLPGRIGDSCVVGAGCYANNDTCAVSGTGSGEILITHVVGYAISALVKLKKMSLQEACDYVISRAKHTKREQGIGVISIDKKGNIGVSFNTQIMKRAWITPKGEVHVQIAR